MLEKSWAGVFRSHLLNHLSVEKLAPFFNVDRGRPSKDLYAAVGALILQQLHDLTDAQVVEQLAFNLIWHYALDIRDDSDVYICVPYGIKPQLILGNTRYGSKENHLKLAKENFPLVVRT